MIKHIINGFSLLNKEEKLKLVVKYTSDVEKAEKIFKSFWINDSKSSKIFDEFSENTISLYGLPYGIAPNFMINGKSYLLPMVTEESSVVAAAAKSAKFWSKFGGFKAKVISSIKTGHVHFLWEGKFDILKEIFPELKTRLLERTEDITANMQKRGGGIIDIELVNLTSELDNYYQIKASFETVDSMGANFINSCLEEFADELKVFASEKKIDEPNIIMSILSNYTPDCIVECSIECEIDNFKELDIDMEPKDFVKKFEAAVQIANVSTYRATTHNKGIFNGIDAIALATGNDFRALEAGGHAFAARNGKYKSLTEVKITKTHFKYSLTIPVAVGTVGGLTMLHPLAKLSLELLDNPKAKELMMIIATAGLSNNFSAVKSLVTKGIQLGHMKMHLINILNSLDASEAQKKESIDYFKTRKVSVNSVREFLNT